MGTIKKKEEKKRYRIFAALMKELRLKAGINTLQELAQKTELGISTINGYSRGQDIPGTFISNCLSLQDNTLH